MKCYMNNCINNGEWACMYRDDCDECNRGCKNYYRCSSCDYYMDDDVIDVNINIQFPHQYLEQFIRGEITLDEAVEYTTKEVERLIKEYIKEHNLYRGGI